MIVTNLQQGTEAWKIARLGTISGTRLKDVFKKDYYSLIEELIAETETGQYNDIYINAAMQRGIDLEPIALKVFNSLSKKKYSAQNFCIHSEYNWLTLSPDAFSTDYQDACEIKCPTAKVHVKYIRMDKPPTEYNYQCIQYFIVNENLKALHFVSYCPEFKSQPIFIKTIKRKDAKVDYHLDKVLKFREKWLEVANSINEKPF